MRIAGPIAHIALYSALYAAFGAASPFWPKFFETRALTPQEISSILAAAMLVRLVSGPALEGSRMFSAHYALCSQAVLRWRLERQLH